MNSSRSLRSALESAALAVALTLTMASGSDAEISQLAAAQDTPPSGAQPQVDEAAGQKGERIAAQTLTDNDRKFIETALKGGTAEVQEAKLAQEKAASKDVKTAAADLERDHTKANGELKKIASSNGVAVKEEAPPDRKALYERLQGLSGQSFDKEYVQAGIKAHRRTIDLFQRTEAETKNPQIKTFAGSTLPTLKHHLEMMQALDGK
jgi:putative membrane protein